MLFKDYYQGLYQLVTSERVGNSRYISVVVILLGWADDYEVDGFNDSDSDYTDMEH